jgi:hypothetical protein
MDLSFFRRAEARFASRTAAAPDYGMLVAILQTRQAASLTARAQARFAAFPDIKHPIVELLLAGPRWRLAAQAQRGCFARTPFRQGAVN